MTLIDKDALKKDVLDLPNCYNGFSDTYDKACIIGVIDEQPTIEERKWIPCSERLPEEKSDWKTVTVVDESGDTVFTYSSVGFYLSDGWWIVDNEPMECDALIRVIAWMPLPESYSGETKSIDYENKGDDD